MTIVHIADEFKGWKVICVDRLTTARLTLAEEYRSLKKMAELTGIPQPQLSLYFSGKQVPNLKNLKKLVLYLQVPADYLLGLRITEEKT